MKILFSAIFVLFPGSFALADEVMDATADYCKCANPVLQETDNMIASLKDGDVSKLQQLMVNVQQKLSGLETCTAKLEEKYGRRINDKEFESRVTAEIEKQCPPPKGIPLGIPRP